MSYRDPEETRNQKTLVDLLASRRKKHPCIHPTSGEFEDDKAFWLTAFASCLSTPILLFLAYFFSRFQFNLRIFIFLIVQPTGITLIYLLSAFFILLFASSYINAFIGFCFGKRVINFLRLTDKLTKADARHTRNWISTVATVLLLVLAYFLFNMDAESKQELLYIIIGLAFLLPIANLGSTRNSLTFAPSQDVKLKLYHIELIVQSVFITLMLVTPIITELIAQGGCNCDAACTTKTAPSCVTCYTNCDTFPDHHAGLRICCIILTTLAGAANIIGLFYVTPRTDDTFETIPSTFVSRIREASENYYHWRISILGGIETLIMFTVVGYLAYYLIVVLQVDVACLANNEGGLFGGYACTKSFAVIVGTVLFVAIVCVYRWIAERITASHKLWKYVPLFSLGVGFLVLLTHEMGEFETIMVWLVFVTAFTSVGFSKVLSANAIVYDEYLYGHSEPYFPSMIFLMRLMLGFFVGVAFALTFLDSGYVANTAPMTTGAANSLGIFLIAASVIWFLVKLWISRYDIAQFDKIHVAIERNLASDNDDVSFIDPIQNEEIKRPVSLVAKEKKDLAKALRDLSVWEAVLALTDDHNVFSSIRKTLWWSLGLYTAAFIASGFFLIVKWATLADASIWWNYLAMLVFTHTGEGIILFLVSLDILARLEETELFGATRHTINKIAETLDHKEYNIYGIVNSIIHKA